MAEFFHRADGVPGPGLALFVNAGDPPLCALDDLVLMLDEEGVDCLELAVPFPDSVTDGPVIRRSARRALRQGAELADVLAFVARVRPRLRNLRIALLADFGHSLRHRRPAEAAREIADSGADGLLVHAVPPRLQARWYAAVHEAGLPVVTTCYQQSPEPTKAAAAAAATAYVYLVAQYGRSGTAPAAGHAGLAGTVAALKARTACPVAVGFGVRSRDDVEAVRATGADGVIVGSAAVQRIEDALLLGIDAIPPLKEFIRSLRPLSGVATPIPRS